METERITIAGDTSGQDFSLRVLRFQGRGTGASVYIQAGLHANEMPGMVALDRLIPRLLKAEAEGRLAGNVTLVPNANPIGLAQAVFGETLGRFDFNSRVNFNRAFPAEPEARSAGKPAAVRLKSVLLDLAVQADVVLDIHCDDEGPVYLYVLDRQLDEGHRLARAMRADVILTENGLDLMSFDLSVLARWAANPRSPETRFAATIELRGMKDVTPALADQDAAGLYRYLVDIGTIVDATLPDLGPHKALVGDVDAAEMIPTPVPGTLLYDVTVGDWVTQDQRLAVVVSDAGLPPHEILSPFDGMVMTRLDRRLARRGEDVIKVLRHPRP